MNPPLDYPARMIRRYDRILIGALTALAISGAVGGWLWWQQRGAALREAQVETAAREAAPVLAAMEKAASTPPDIDSTIRVIHELDRALADHTSMRDYFAAAAAEDYSGVAPEVLAGRKRILTILSRLYGLETRAEDQQAMWELSSEYLLKAMSLVEVEGSLTSPVGVDRAQAQRLLEDIREEKAEKADLTEAIRGEQEELFDAVTAYSAALRPHVEAWDKLCLLRDRARLAARNGDWTAARVAAEAAITMAPREREAHLLAAQALLEGGSDEDLGRVDQLLAAVLAEHPDQSAPALLLEGILARRRGDTSAATLAFQQSAANYPKQAMRLADMLDPYKQRAWLDKSREGSWILESYRSTMLGAGTYSPDLQLAKDLFAAGKFDEGKARVLEHFGRRRAQAQWDFLLSDVGFCIDLLGADYRSIFPEDAWLDLVVEPEFIGKGIALSVNNRSQRSLRNATLILALQYTDMLPGQYVATAAERTLPVVLPRETTDFGRMDVDIEWLGKPKGVGDIVQHRAVLLTDDAVIWVDTDAYKIAEAKEFREVSRRSTPSATQREMGERLDTLAREAAAAASITAATRLGQDGVVIRLPRGLSILGPVFRLEYAGNTIVATSNVIEGEEIVLDFRGLANFEDSDLPLGDIVLTVGTVFGERTLKWTPAGPLAWRFAGLSG